MIKLHIQAAFLVPLMCLLTSCASGPSSLKMSSTPQTKLSASQTAIQIGRLSDDRPENAMLTDIYGREMQGEELMEWLQSSLYARGISTSSSEEVDTCSIDLDLKRVTVSAASGTSKHSSIVFALFPQGGDEEDRVIIRGNASGMNWIGGSGETNASLNASLDDAVSKIRDYCKKAAA